MKSIHLAFDLVVDVVLLSCLPYILGENKEQRDIKSCKGKKIQMFPSVSVGSTVRYKVLKPCSGSV